MDQSRLNAIDAFLQEKYIASRRLPGLQLLVHHRGQPVHHAIAGHADRERNIPWAENTIARIYSMTKPLTSVAAMQLVENGKLALEDPVHRYIPEWRNLGVFAAGTHRIGFQTVPARRPMTVLDLFRHTAGLTYGFQLRTNVDAAYRGARIGELEKAGTLSDMIANLAKIPLDHHPGEAWTYSVATDVLGWLVQVVSGMPFEDYLRNNVLEPAGMADTGFHVRPENHARLAACYQAGQLGAGGRDGRATLQDDPETSPYREPPAFVSGGGGLTGTAADYMRFCEALRTGKPRLIGRKTLELMTANHLPGGVDLPALSRSLFSEASYEGVGFGLGFATTTSPARTGIAGSAGDYFWGGAASTFFWIDPVEELSVVFLTQLIPSSTYPVRRELRTMLYAALD